MYGRIIISEVNVNDSNKSIHPAGMGGIAGGKKFVLVFFHLTCQVHLPRDLIQGNFFHCSTCHNYMQFATDVRLPNSDVWMYGGPSENTEYAMKAAKHELRSLISFYNCHIHELRVPLMALIDWRGKHRFQACPHLHLPPKTLPALNQKLSSHSNAC